jgi:hypothetical protein
MQIRVGRRDVPIASIAWDLNTNFDDLKNAISTLTRQEGRAETAMPRRAFSGVETKSVRLAITILTKDPKKTESFRAVTRNTLFNLPGLSTNLLETRKTSRSSPNGARPLRTEYPAKKKTITPVKLAPF